VATRQVSANAFTESVRFVPNDGRAESHYDDPDRSQVGHFAEIRTTGLSKADPSPGLAEGQDEHHPSQL
jgi:hypothetical protein